jgi:hypothetical protein
MRRSAVWAAAGAARRGALPSVVLAMLAGALLGCAPAASTVPLGRGPLAIAEQDAEARALAKRSHPPARAERKHAEPAVVSEPVAKADSAKAVPADTDDDDDDDDEKSGSSKRASRQPAFEGLYAGDDIAVYRIAGIPDREERDDKAKIRIEAGSGDSINITLINSADGSDLCQLVARVEGHTALIENAQPCFSDGSEGSPEAELTSGRAVLEGDRLRMDAQGTISLPLPDQELDGELSYTFKGDRQ